MVKPPQRPPQRPTSRTRAKTGATKPGAGAKGPAAASSSKPAEQATKRTATPDTDGTAAARDGKLTSKPTTIDLKANETKKPAPVAPKASSTASATSAASKTPASSASSSATTGKTTTQKSEPTPKETKPTLEKAKPASSAAQSSSAAPTSSSSAGSKSTLAASSGAHTKQKNGGTGFLALILAGIFGGALSLLGAFALLGSGALSGLLADDASERPDETQEQIVQLSSDLGGFSSRLQDMQSAIDDVQTKLGEQQPNLTGPMAKIEQEVSNVQQKLDEHIVAIEQNADLQTSAANSELISDMQEEIRSSLSENSEKLTGMNNLISTIQERQLDLENSVAAGNAGEAPALAALEQRLSELSALRDNEKTQNTNAASAIREELGLLDEEMQKLQIKMSVMENLQLISETQQSTLSELSSTMQTVAQKTDKLEASVSEDPPAESGLMVGSKLSYVQNALDAALKNGSPMTGLLVEAKELLATQDNAAELPDNLMAAAANGIVPLSSIATQIEEARDAYEASKAQAIDVTKTEGASPEDEGGLSADGLLKGLMKGAQSLVQIRDVEAPPQSTPSDPVSALLADAVAAAKSSDLVSLDTKLDALQTTDTSPETLKASAQRWSEQVSHHLSLAGLSEQLDAVQQTIWAQDGEGERP